MLSKERHLSSKIPRVAGGGRVAHPWNRTSSVTDGDVQSQRDKGCGPSPSERAEFPKMVGQRWEEGCVAETAKCSPQPASSSTCAHSCISFLNLPVVSSGHVTEFWPMA